MKKLNGMKKLIGAWLLVSLLGTAVSAGQLTLDTQANPSTTPASGKANVYVNSTNKELTQKDDAGTTTNVRTLANAGQTTTAGADIYIVGSNIKIPTQGVRTSTVFRWTLMMSKTAACTSTPIYNVRVGTAATTSDSARVTWTSGQNQTAATDSGMLVITCLVTTTGASGVISCTYMLTHKNASTGFTNSLIADTQGPTASSAFDLTVAATFVGLSINPGNTGANAVWTINTLAEAYNL